MFRKPRNRLLRKRLACLATAAGVAGWAIIYFLGLGSHQTPVLLTLYLANAGLVAYYLVAVGFVRKYLHRPPARGTVLAIVPAFNEEPQLLGPAIEALLNQTIVPDEIHIMDDGSLQHPVRPFANSRVVWHRQPNGGKRHAQANVLGTLDPDDWDFILTVDSDSVPAPDALERLLQAMDDPKVMAATGLILTRNWQRNWLTRISDLNIGTSCLMIRTSRSVIGAVETTSGALALYRARVVFKNLSNYVASGTNGDDRRLTMYALMEGDVVVVNEALVHSAMPETVKGLYRQRLRWGKSAWQALPFIAINLRPKFLIFPTLGFYQWLVLPFLVAWAIKQAFTLDAGYASQFAMAFAAYLVIRSCETAMYLVDRPGMSRRTRLWTWLLLTPAEILVRIAVIYPAKYMAILKLRDRGWVSRGNAHATSTSSPRPPVTRMGPTVFMRAQAAPAVERIGVGRRRRSADEETQRG
jgi:hyaluronan synthase